MGENRVIHPSVKIPETSKVWQFATICENTIIGDDVVIGSSVWIGRNCRIGDRVRIQTGAFIPNGSIIENDVFIGPNVTMTDDKYPRSGNKDYFAEPPYIEARASIGAGAVILPGIKIGEGAMVGAGAVVTKDVTIGDTTFGVPSKSIHYEETL